MAEKFNPAAHDKHAADPREAARADREMHEKLENGSGGQLSGVRSRERRATGAVEGRRRSRERVAVGQGALGFQVISTGRLASMKTEFNHAANDSPRSGSTKKVAPVVGAAIVVAIIAIAVCLKMLA